MKNILNERTYKNVFSNILLEDTDMQKNVATIVKKMIKNGDIKPELSDIIKRELKDGDSSKELEKKVKAIVADTVTNLFKTLWYKRDFFDHEIRH